MRNSLREKYVNLDYSSKIIRIIIIASIFSFVFVFMTVVHKIAWTPNSPATYLLPLPSVPGPISQAVPESDIDFEEIWDNIDVKGADPNEQWFKGEGDGVIVICGNGKCRTVNGTCQPNATFIPLKFQTPGGYVTTYVKSEEEKRSFEEDIRPSLTALMVLMAEDPSTTLLDIGTDDTITSIAVASLGNHVVVVTPHRPNVQRLCNGVIDSELTDKCFVLVNAVLDVKEPFKKDPISGDDYVINIDKSQLPDMKKGQRRRRIKSLMLPDILLWFSMTNAAIRLGTHNATKALFGAEAFFKQVHVRFVILCWSAIRAEHQESVVYGFLKQRGFEPFCYKGQFEQLDFSQTESWPDDVIFRRLGDANQVPRPAVGHGYQSSTYTSMLETTTSVPEMRAVKGGHHPGWAKGGDERHVQHSVKSEDNAERPATHPPGGRKRQHPMRGDRGGGDSSWMETTSHPTM